MVFGDMLDLGSVLLKSGIKMLALYASNARVLITSLGFGEKARLGQSSSLVREGRHFESKAALTSWIESLDGEMIQKPKDVGAC